MPALLPWILAWYVAASLVTLAAYGLDKRRATRGGRRVPERTLHLLALAGGWPGAWAGRRFFRHKTQKRGFTAVLVLSSLLHAAFWGWWAAGRWPALFTN